MRVCLFVCLFVWLMAHILTSFVVSLFRKLPSTLLFAILGSKLVKKNKLIYMLTRNEGLCWRPKTEKSWWSISCTTVYIEEKTTHDRFGENTASFNGRKFRTKSVRGSLYGSSFTSKNISFVPRADRFILSRNLIKEANGWNQFWKQHTATAKIPVIINYLFCIDSTQYYSQPNELCNSRTSAAHPSADVCPQAIVGLTSVFPEDMNQERGYLIRKTRGTGSRRFLASQ